jgi:hypothetical protein
MIRIHSDEYEPRPDMVHSIFHDPRVCLEPWVTVSLLTPTKEARVEGGIDGMAAIRVLSPEQRLWILVH